MNKRFGLGMRLGLGLALLAISWGARAFGGTAELQVWNTVQLPQYVRERFISDSHCYSNSVYLRSCLRALQTASSLVLGHADRTYTDDDVSRLIRDPHLRFSITKSIDQLARSTHALPTQLVWGRAIAAHLQEYDRYADLLPSAEEEAARVQDPLVNATMLNDGYTGFISIQSFDGRDLCAKVGTEIQRLVATHAKRLVFDLRNNPGGNRRNSLCIAGLLMGLKPVIGVRSVANAAPSVQGLLHGNSHESVKWLLGTQLQLTELPVYVWINHNSASAAEILAGSLQTHGRATLIGEPSRGKARIQMVEPLRGTDLSISLTIEELILPNGRSYQDKGLVPDVFVPSNAVPEFVTKVLLN